MYLGRKQDGGTILRTRSTRDHRATGTHWGMELETSPKSEPGSEGRDIEQAGTETAGETTGETPQIQGQRKAGMQARLRERMNGKPFQHRAPRHQKNAPERDAAGRKGHVLTEIRKTKSLLISSTPA